MAVYERGYRNFTGPLTPQVGRFLVIPRFAYREIFDAKLFTAFFAACFILPVILAILIYLPHNVSFLKALKAQAGGTLFGFSFDANFFLVSFMVPQGWLAFFMAFIVGPELISTDLRHNAMPLYLSRPFSRWEYILGKLSVLVLLLSIITWVPGLLLFGLQAYLEGGEWFRANFRIGPAIFLASWVQILVVCLISLALSAYVKWKQIARIGLFAVFVVAGGLSGVVNQLLDTKWGGLINVADMLRVVWMDLFDVKRWDSMPAGAAWLSLAAVCALCLALLARRVRAYEVVR